MYTCRFQFWGELVLLVPACLGAGSTGVHGFWWARLPSVWVCGLWWSLGWVFRVSPIDVGVWAPMAFTFVDLSV